LVAHVFIALLFGAAGARASVILLSQEACSSGGLLHGTSHAPRPIQISFPGYSPAELISVRTAAERAAQSVPSSLHRSEPARMDCSSPTRQLQWKLSR
jgi:hypothetical protein